MPFALEVVAINASGELHASDNDKRGLRCVLPAHRTSLSGGNSGHPPYPDIVMSIEPKQATPSPTSSGAGEQTDIAFWDDQWNDRASRSLVQRLFHGRDFGPQGLFLRVMDRHVGLARFRDANVVEFGGAASRFLLDLALHAGARVTAVDFSPVGIQATAQLFKRHGVSGQAIHADMFNWNVEPGSFDFVTHWGLLEHFDDPFPVLEASARVTRPGGSVVFTMPNMEAAGARLWRRFAPDNFAKHILHSDARINEACSRAGLVLERTFHFGAPLLRMAPPERGGIGPLIANAAHAGVCLVGTALPTLYVRGSRGLSNNRGFIARRPPHD